MVWLRKFFKGGMNVFDASVKTLEKWKTFIPSFTHWKFLIRLNCIEQQKRKIIFLNDRAVASVIRPWIMECTYFVEAYFAVELIIAAAEVAAGVVGIAAVPCPCSLQYHLQRQLPAYWRQSVFADMVVPDSHWKCFQTEIFIFHFSNHSCAKHFWKKHCQWWLTVGLVLVRPL